jgi:hypothetical protein
VAAKLGRTLLTGAVSTFNPATSVFLNCPYDLDYRPLFDAAVLATVCCGLTPRIALDTGTIAEPRLARILNAIFKIEIFRPRSISLQRGRRCEFSAFQYAF